MKKRKKANKIEPRKALQIVIERQFKEKAINRSILTAIITGRYIKLTNNLIDFNQGA